MPPRLSLRPEIVTDSDASCPLPHPKYDTYSGAWSGINRLIVTPHAAGHIGADATSNGTAEAIGNDEPLIKLNYSTSVMGLWALSPSSEYRAAGFMLPSVVDTRPPHHAVRQKTSWPI
jgi:hypothetical protein